MSVATVVATASQELLKKLAVDTGISTPIFYEGADAGSKAVSAELQINKLQDTYGVDSFDARVVVYTGQAFELGTFSTLESSLAAGLGVTTLGSFFTAAPEAVVLFVGGTFMIADWSEAINHDVQDFILNHLILTDGWQAFKDNVAEWYQEGHGIAYDILGITETDKVDIALTPTQNGFDAEVKSSTFNLLDLVKGITDTFEQTFYEVTDKATVLFTEGEDSIQGIIDGAQSHTINAPGWVVTRANDGDDVVLRSGDLTVDPDHQKHSIIDGGAGTDTISYDAVTSFPNGLEINLKEGVSTPLGTNWGVPLDVLDNFEHVIGTNYADRIVGSAGADTLEGSGGNDVIWGGEGTVKSSGAYTAADYGKDDKVGDSLVGGAGSDTIFAGQGDTVDGGADGDVIYAYNATSIFGGDGNDTIYV